MDEWRAKIPLAYLWFALIAIGGFFATTLVESRFLFLRALNPPWMFFAAPLVVGFVVFIGLAHFVGTQRLPRFLRDGARALAAEHPNDEVWVVSLNPLWMPVGGPAPAEPHPMRPGFLRAGADGLELLNWDRSPCLSGPWSATARVSAGPRVIRLYVMHDEAIREFRFAPLGDSSALVAPQARINALARRLWRRRVRNTPPQPAP